MELQQMRYAVAIAETKNFTRAAERCSVVQSALSRQVARLERELGAKLFERDSRGVRMTPAGEAFIPVAQECLHTADRAAAEVAAASRDLRGQLAVGLIPTVAAVDVPAALEEFRSRYPSVRISLRVGKSEDLAEQVIQGSLDVAFVGLPATSRPKGVRSHILARDQLVAVVSPVHPLAKEREVTLDQIASEVFVDLPEGTAGRIQSDQAFDAAGIERDIAFEVTTADFITRLVEKNLCIAMLPSAYVPRLVGITAVKVSDAPTRVEYALWTRFGRTPAASAFLEVLGVPMGT